MRKNNYLFVYGFLYVQKWLKHQTIAKKRTRHGIPFVLRVFSMCYGQSISFGILRRIERVYPCSWQFFRPTTLWWSSPALIASVYPLYALGLPSKPEQALVSYSAYLLLLRSYSLCSISLIRVCSCRFSGLCSLCELICLQTPQVCPLFVDPANYGQSFCASHTLWLLQVCLFFQAVY